MIVALHAATGALTGELTRSNRSALALGPPLHLASDRVPHRHPHWLLDCLAGGMVLAYVVARRGPTDPATIGALAAIAPDLKRPKRQPQPRRRRRPRGLRVGIQLALAALMLAPLSRPRGSVAERPHA